MTHLGKDEKWSNFSFSEPNKSFLELSRWINFSTLITCAKFISSASIIINMPLWPLLVALWIKQWTGETNCWRHFLGSQFEPNTTTYPIFSALLPSRLPPKCAIKIIDIPALLPNGNIQESLQVAVKIIISDSNKRSRCAERQKNGERKKFERAIYYSIII